MAGRPVYQLESLSLWRWSGPPRSFAGVPQVWPWGHGACGAEPSLELASLNEGETHSERQAEAFRLRSIDQTDPARPGSRPGLCAGSFGCPGGVKHPSHRCDLARPGPGSRSPVARIARRRRVRPGARAGGSNGGPLVRPPTALAQRCLRRGSRRAAALPSAHLVSL